MVTEKIVDGCRVICFTPDLNEEDRKRAEREAVKNILRDYNRLESQKEKKNDSKMVP
jgi:hypothetical protein